MTNPSSDDFTQTLISARVNQRISPRELAKRAGTTQAVISRIENKTVNPSISLVNRLFHALGQNTPSPTLDKISHKLTGEYRTLNQSNISSTSLKHNFKFFQSQNPQAQIAPVLKANAYGHGLVGVGEWIANNLSVPFVCVDSLFEAYELKNASVPLPILIMGYTHPKNYQVFTRFSDIHVTVFDPQTLQALSKYQPHAKIHLKIDTGMHRLGIVPKEIPAWITYLKKHPHSQIIGIMSHLSSADSDAKYTNQQLATFKKAIHSFETAGFSFTYKHIAATAGSFLIKDPEFNVIRLGLGFYGYSPFSAPSRSNLAKKSILSGNLQDPGLRSQYQLRPSLTLTSTIAQIKRVGKGSRISYNGTHITSKPTLIGILPIGYSDGLSRELSNKGFVYVDTKACRIIGNITMNQTIIDLTDTKDVRVGDRVEVISPHHEQKNSITSLSQHQHTIPYTILTSLNPSIKRKIT
jgi:alanine racemase